MKHAPYEELFHRLQLRARNRIDDSLTVTRLPIDRYLSEERWAAERQHVFRAYPQPVAHGSELAPGQVMAFEHLDTPIILTRDKMGTPHAFVNVCMHRGTRLLNDDGVCARTRLVCPYHAWSYRLTGDLASIPLEQEAFPGIDKGDYSLKALPCHELGGLLWVTQDPDSPVDGAAHIAPLVDDLSVLDVASHVVFAKSETRVKANWKLLADAFLESYHIHRLHSRTLAGFFMDSVTEGDDLGLHMRAAVARTDLTSVDSPPTDAFSLRSLVTYNLTVFPAATVITSPDYINLLAFYPRGPHETIATNTMMIPASENTEDAREHWTKSFHLLDEGVFKSEDFQAAELSHAGLLTGGLAEMTVGRLEGAMSSFHERLDTVLATASEAAGR